jgi:hypothetical protein
MDKKKYTQARNKTKVHMIAELFNDKNCTLANCFENPQKYGYLDLGEFLDDLEHKRSEIHNSDVREWNEINIGHTLMGFAGVRAETLEIKGRLKALTNKIKESTAKLTGQAIGNSLYGLQNMDATTEEVKELLKALTSKIESSPSKVKLQGNG